MMEIITMFPLHVHVSCSLEGCSYHFTDVHDAAHSINHSTDALTLIFIPGISGESILSLWIIWTMDLMQEVMRYRTFLKMVFVPVLQLHPPALGNYFL